MAPTAPPPQPSQWLLLPLSLPKPKPKPFLPPQLLRPTDRPTDRPTSAKAVPEAPPASQPAKAKAVPEAPPASQPAKAVSTSSAVPEVPSSSKLAEAGKKKQPLLPQNRQPRSQQASNKTSSGSSRKRSVDPYDSDEYGLKSEIEANQSQKQRVQPQKSNKKK